MESLQHPLFDPGPLLQVFKKLQQVRGGGDKPRHIDGIWIATDSPFKTFVNLFRCEFCSIRKGHFRLLWGSGFLIHIFTADRHTADCFETCFKQVNTVMKNYFIKLKNTML